MSLNDCINTMSPGRREENAASGIECGLAGLLLVVHTLLLAWVAYRHSPTQDEVAHLPAGLAIWRYGDFGVYRVNPPLTRAAAGLALLTVDHQEDWSGYRPGSPLRQEWRLGAQFLRANEERGLWLCTIARWWCLPFAVAGGWLCWQFAREAGGPLAGLTALGMWCVDPNILGHGSLITPDITSVTCGLGAAYMFYKWSASPSYSGAFVAGLALGAALLSKTYWVVLFALWPVFGLIVSRSGSRAGGANHEGGSMPADGRQCKLRCAWSTAGQVACMLAVGLNVLNLGYGFQGTGARLGELPFYSRVLAGQTLNPERDLPGNAFRDTDWGKLPIPVPSDYITGIDVQRADFELGKWSYLLGEVSEQGWWYYYIIGLAVKVPVGTWLLAGLGIWCALMRRKLAGDSGCLARGSISMSEMVPLVVPAVVIFVLASSQTGINRHVRYVFPVLPVLFVLAGIGVQYAWQTYHSTDLSRGLRTVVLSVAVCGLALTFSTLRYFPHCLSYFNELAGGPAAGDRVLVDSNLDWGQDLIYVKEWLATYPDKRPVHVDWLGYANLADWGIDAPLLSPGPLLPGWYIISRHRLHAPHGDARQFADKTPIEQIGGAFHVYRVE